MGVFFLVRVKMCRRNESETSGLVEINQGVTQAMVGKQTLRHIVALVFLSAFPSIHVIKTLAYSDPSYPPLTLMTKKPPPTGSLITPRKQTEL